MNFDTMQKIVFESLEFPKNADFEELLHLLALKGTQAYFREKVLSKDEATATKSKIRENLVSRAGEDGGSNLVSAEQMKQVSSRQDKIRTAVLLHANPYVLFMQACKCISILTGDNDFFFRQVERDCKEIAGNVIDATPTGEEEERQLREDIVRLQHRMHGNDDADSVHILSRAIGAMQARLETLIGTETADGPIKW